MKRSAGHSNRDALHRVEVAKDVGEEIIVVDAGVTQRDREMRSGSVWVSLRKCGVKRRCGDSVKRGGTSKAEMQ